MRIWRIAAAGLCLTGLVGCTSFLDADQAVNDPNNPTAASRNQIFTGVQANIFGQQEGPVAMVICEWMQQCAGTAGRFVEQQGTYSIDPVSFDFSFSSIYTAGGLVGIRAVQESATADGDIVYRGVARVLEALNMLFAADVWGAVPYSEAVDVTITTPVFDSQMQIYTDLLTVLDNAIADLGGAGSGPGAFDLIYGGDKAKWIQAAHTLKARIYLHRAEMLGTSQYALALTEANLGISAPANDFTTAHSTATSERNMWAQFQNTSFGADLVAGKVLADIMVARSDPRLPEYFGTNGAGGYGGYDVVTGTTPASQISPIGGSARTDNPEFRQPIITYDENQLIKAEASFRAGNVAAAATALNAVRARYGAAAIATPTLANIMTEKYIVLFQNIEVWNDWKRTCLPSLRPALGKSSIPSRLYYGDTEENTNPNTPSFATQQASPRNANDPNACAASGAPAT